MRPAIAAIVNDRCLLSDRMAVPNLAIDRLATGGSDEATIDLIQACRYMTNPNGTQVVEFSEHQVVVQRANGAGDVIATILCGRSSA